MNDYIKIRGARQHNLQNINLDIPKNKFIVFTGVSGSGKSSLAFDTIYAEGQRRYVESLSAYARQFLGVMDKPDVDLIEGLSPSISIDQKTVSHNPRSTVGTITEIYDYLRLLFARIGHPHCPNCGREISKLSVDEIVAKIIAVVTEHCSVTTDNSPIIYQIKSPIVRQRKGEFKDLFLNIRAKGYTKITIDKKEIDLSKNTDFVLIKTNKHNINVIIDTISVRKRDARNEIFMGNLKTRLRTAVEQATNLSDGLVILSVGATPRLQLPAAIAAGGQVAVAQGRGQASPLQNVIDHLFSQKFSCPFCNLSLPELEPRMFSFNSPIGACEKCKGIGTVYEIDVNRILKRNLSVNEGGILPLRNLIFNDTWYARLLRTVAKKEDIDLSCPIENLGPDKLNLLLNGTGREYEVFGTNRFGHPTRIFETFNGVIPDLKKRYFGSESDEIEGWDAEKYLKEEECPACHGDKLKPEVLGVTINNLNIAKVGDFAVDKLIEWVNSLSRFSVVSFQFSDKSSSVVSSPVEKTDKLKTDKPNSDNRQLKTENREIRVNPFMLNEYELQVAKPILKEINTRLTFLRNVGLSYLTIGRKAKTLSGGELQRIRLASQIGTGLTGVLYVLDEPSIGLHPKDVAALIASLKSLRDLGNTLIIVEHDQETIESADHVVELGPWAGKQGGKVTFEGTVSEMKKSKKSLTGMYLSGKKRIISVGDDFYVVPQKGQTWKSVPTNNKNIRNNPQEIPARQGLKPQAMAGGRENPSCLELKGCKQFNLKNIDIQFPLGALIAVTGVSGSGKSTLIVETLYPALKYYLDGYFTESMGEFRDLTGATDLKKVYLVDQSPIGRTPRSNPATYVGFFDEIRDIFALTQEARLRGFKKGRFSFNVKGGRCEKCEGAGVLKVEMQFLADVFVTCDVCHGKRYNSETLEVTYKGKTIADVLGMTVDEAAEFFVNHPRVLGKLTFLKQVGLEYISLGQGAPTFSGGEAQRIKLANELSRRDAGQNLYILDEPTTGLHFYDVEKLLRTLRALVNRGNTVIIIEHNLDVVKNSDWIIDLGPGGGDAGGAVVYQGELHGIKNCKKSYTGEYLKKKKT